jgi:hypothetical protein
LPLKKAIFQLKIISIVCLFIFIIKKEKVVNKMRLIVLVCLVLLGMMVATPALAFPKSFVFQANVADKAAGNLNGKYDVTLKLYDTNGQSLWQEQLLQQSFVNGRVEIEVGKTVDVTASVLAQAVTIGMIVNGKEAKIRLMPSPLALLARDSLTAQDALTAQTALKAQSVSWNNVTGKPADKKLGELSGTLNATQVPNGFIQPAMMSSALTPSVMPGKGLQVTGLSFGVIDGTASGQVLTWNGSGWTASAPTGGSSGGTAGGDLTGTYPDPTLTTTGVTAATYGSATQTPVFAVDTKGRITGVTNTPITGVTPGGSAGGDLTGTYPNPTLGVSGVTAATYGAATQVPVLTIDAKGRITNASTVAVSSILTGTAGGDLTGSYPDPTLAVTGVGSGTYGSATQTPVFTVDAKGRITGAVNTPISGVTPGGPAGGDLSGTYPNPTVANIQGRAISTDAPTDSSILVWNGAAWTPVQRYLQFRLLGQEVTMLGPVDSPGEEIVVSSRKLTRTVVNLTSFLQARLQFLSSQASSTIKCHLDYSTDNGTSWSTLLADVSASTTADAVSKGSWVSVPAGAKSEVLVRAVVVGNGTLSTIISSVVLELR